MFRIGIVELAVTCVVILLAIVIPTVIIWFHKRIESRLKNLEDKLGKKNK